MFTYTYDIMVYTIIHSIINDLPVVGVPVVIIMILIL